MNNKITTLIRNPFLWSSGIVLAGSTIANFLNYFYNLVLGRMLTPQEYGEAAVLTTLILIVSVPGSTLTTFVAKYVAEYRAKKQLGGIAHLYRQVTRYSFILGIAALVVCALLNPFFARLLNISKLPLLIFWLIIPATLVMSASRGLLQGLESFSAFTISSLVGTVLKIGLAILLLALHFSMVGVVLSLILSTVGSYLYNLYKAKLPQVDPSQNQFEVSAGTSAYLNIVFWFTLFWALFGNIDVLFAKHYLSNFDAGQYAALAVMGRIVTYSSLAMVSVLFPMAAHSHASGSNTGRKLLVLSLLTVAIISFLVVAVFYFFPEITVKILFSSKYLPIAHYLAFFGSTMALGAIGVVFASYFMAIHNKNFIYPFAISTILQIVGLGFYHDNISQIIWDLFVTSLLFALSMAVLYLLNRPSEPVTDVVVAENLTTTR